MKNVTLSADEALIEAARRRAAAEKTTLNEQFRLWLADYSNARGRMQHLDEVMAQLQGQMSLGRPMPSRDEMNER